MANPKITIHMVSSLDGFIAKKDGRISWMESKDHYESGITLTKDAIDEFVQGIDCYVMGSRTYESTLIHGWAYGDIPVIVLTKRNLSSERKNVEFYAGDLEALINNRLKLIYQNIWMVGGAMAANNFIQLGLADDIIISVLPIILGDGISFFNTNVTEMALHLRDVTTYKDGMVELWYEIKK